MTYHAELFEVLLKGVCLCLTNDIVVAVWEWTCTGPYARGTSWRNRTLWATVTCVTRTSTSINKRALKQNMKLCKYTNIIYFFGLQKQTLEYFIHSMNFNSNFSTNKVMKCGCCKKKNARYSCTIKLKQFNDCNITWLTLFNITS